ncbi:MAG: signal peptidase I [Candidatus Gracilibacteria bacterium]|nr:signal peptidase I [Candidatus Gracilibacteria bacterium]
MEENANVENEIESNIPDTENSHNNEVNTEITELKPEKSRMQEFIEFLRDLIIIFIIVMIIRTYIAAPFQISGGSMDTSYHNNEFIIVDKLSYVKIGALEIGNPTRGDVVIFRPHANNGKEFYIKRVLGLPGDTIKFENGEVFIKRPNDKDFIKLNESYLSETNIKSTFLGPDIKENSFTVPEGDYFLMGDNRVNSSDSRSCFLSCSIKGSSHFIKRGDILGKVFLDFGYFNIFKEGTFELGELKWNYPPRFLNTPRKWIYKELN